MHLIHLATKKVVGSQTHSADVGLVNYNESLYSAIERYGGESLISIHNHPYSSPPSSYDFTSSYNRGYRLGLIVCHDGDVYVYKASNIRITRQLFADRIDIYQRRPYNMPENVAYKTALREFGIVCEKR